MDIDVWCFVKGDVCIRSRSQIKKYRENTFEADPQADQAYRGRWQSSSR